MKILSYPVIFILISALLIRCTKEESPGNGQQYIIAGEKPGNSIYKDYQPDLKMVMVNESVNGIPTTSSYGDLFINANLDGSNDVHFHAYSDKVHSINGSFIRTEGCTVKSVSDHWSVEVCFTPCYSGDTIDNHLLWRKVLIDT
jgi:hypothetical protein